MNWKYKEYIITDDRLKANPDSIKKLLSKSYWAENRDIRTIKKTIENSICISIYLDNEQIGFARIVTDYAVFAWIADIIIEESHRGKGLGKEIMRIIQEHSLIPNSVQVLRTKDAHGLYEKFGFKKCEFMSK
jgi:GNAT superfamily N-acetyltransferase